MAVAAIKESITGNVFISSQIKVFLGERSSAKKINEGIFRLSILFKFFL